MKRFLAVLALAFAFASMSALATNVGVSVTLGEPGYHGRIVQETWYNDVYVPEYGKVKAKQHKEKPDKPKKPKNE